MKVALWAEIRRLAEIEKLSGWAISQQLRCSRRCTSLRRLKLDQPPSREGVHRGSILDAHRSKIAALLVKYPDLLGSAIREEIARGPRWLYRQCLHSPPLRANGPPLLAVVFTRRSGLRAGSGNASRLGRVWPRAGRGDDAQESRLSSLCSATAD